MHAFTWFTLNYAPQVPNWREDKNHYALCVSNKISLKKSKEGVNIKYQLALCHDLYFYILRGQHGG